MAALLRCMLGMRWLAVCLAACGLQAAAAPGLADAPIFGPGIDGRALQAVWSLPGLEAATVPGARDLWPGSLDSSVQVWPGEVYLGQSSRGLPRLGGPDVFPQPVARLPLRSVGAAGAGPAPQPLSVETTVPEPRTGVGSGWLPALALTGAMLLIPWRVRYLRRRAAGSAAPDPGPVAAQRPAAEAPAPGESESRETTGHEPVTVLLAPHQLMPALQAAIEAARGRRSLLGLLCIAPQRFNWVNERFGRAAGEQLLHSVAERLQAGIAKAGEGAAGASLVRGFSGGQFVVMLPKLSVAAAAIELANGLQACFGQPFELDTGVVGCGAGIGVSIFPADGETPDALLARAEVAMHQARLDGPHGVLQYTRALDGPSRRRSEVAGMLISAREEGRLRLHCQPIVSLIGGEVVGYEALMRVVDPSDGSLIGPAEFFPVAEALGVIHGAGLWAIEAVLRLLGDWPHAHSRWPTPKYIGMQVSHVQLMREDFPKQVRRLLRAYGVAPYRLVLEIGESRLPDASDGMLSSIRGLHELGVSLSIKNFSGGSSSLTSLKRFPFSVLKIDRGIVRGLNCDPAARQKVAAIVAIAAVYDLCIVAEGVQSQAQAGVLRELQPQGSLCAQGFLYGSPAEVPGADGPFRPTPAQPRAADQPTEPAATAGLG